MSKCIECKHILMLSPIEAHCDKHDSQEVDIYDEVCKDFESKELWLRLFHQSIMEK